MAEKKTLEERYADEVLTDNTVYSNHYQKGCCRIYPYPQFKPLEIVMNKAECEYYEKEKEKK